MSVDDFEESRRFSPVWRRIMILLTVIAAVPVILWSITVFVRAYVAPPKVPTFRPITTTASIPAAVSEATAAPVKVMTAPARSAAPEESKLPIVEAKATTSDVRGLPPIADGKAPASDSPAAVTEIAPADTAPAPSPWATAPAAAAMPAPPPDTAQAVDDTLPAGAPIVGPVPLPPHRPPLFAMSQQGGIPVPRPRPAVPGETATVAPADINLSSRDFMR